MAVLATLPLRAGIYVYEQTAGPPPNAIALYRRTYILGTASGPITSQGPPVVYGAYPLNDPQAIGSLDDFTNIFGSSSALILDSLEVYLKNTNLGLFYVAIPSNPFATVTVTSTTAGVKSFTVNGTTISYTAIAGDGNQQIVDGLLTAANNNTAINLDLEAEYEIDATGAPIYTNGKLFIRSKKNATFTLTAGTGVTVTAPAVPTSPKYWDYLQAIDNLVELQDDNELGFVCCPEAFYNLTSQYERTQVRNALEQAARSLRWSALLDPGPPSTVNTAALAVAGFSAAVAPSGHASAYFPYAKNLDGDDVAPSVIQGAIALARYEAEGIQEPPCGPAYPILGVGGLRYTLGKAELDLLATNRINPLINKRGVGYVIFDSLTRSTNTNWKFINTRVIFNCLEQSIQDTVDTSNILFRSFGGKGTVFILLRSIVESVVARFYEGNALYGATPEDAYKVRLDAAMQNADDLEAGIVNGEIYAVPAGTIRQVRLVVFRVKINGIATALTTAA